MHLLRALMIITISVLILPKAFAVKDYKEINAQRLEKSKKELRANPPECVITRSDKYVFDCPNNEYFKVDRWSGAIKKNSCDRRSLPILSDLYCACKEPRNIGHQYSVYLDIENEDANYSTDAIDVAKNLTNTFLGDENKAREYLEQILNSKLCK